MQNKPFIILILFLLSQLPAVCFLDARFLAWCTNTELLSDRSNLKQSGGEKKKNTVCLYCHYQQLSEQVVNNAKSTEIVTNTQARQHRGTAL